MRAMDPPAVTPRRFRSEVGLMVGSRVAVVALGVGQSVIAARGLGPEGRGAVAAATSIALILTQVGTLGLTTANPFFIARDPGLRRRLAANSLWYALLVGLVLSFAGISLKLLVPGALPDLATQDLALALASVPAALAAALLQSLLLGEGRTIAYNAIAVLVAAGPVLGLALVALTVGLSTTNALAVICVGQFVAAGLFSAAIRAGGVRWFDRALASRTVRYGLRIYAATLVAFLLIRLDLLLVNGYLGAGATGQYAVAVALVDGLSLLPTSVGFALFGRIARGDSVDLTRRVLQGSAVLFAAVCALAFVLAGPFVRLVFGEQFAPAVELFRWLIPGAYALGLLSIVSQHFAGVGFPRSLLLVWMAGLAVNLAINVAFLSSEGAYIASLSSSVAYVLVLVGHLLLLKRSPTGTAVP